MRGDIGGATREGHVIRFFFCGSIGGFHRGWPRPGLCPAGLSVHSETNDGDDVKGQSGQSELKPRCRGNEVGKGNSGFQLSRLHTRSASAPCEGERPRVTEHVQLFVALSARTSHKLFVPLCRCDLNEFGMLVSAAWLPWQRLAYNARPPPFRRNLNIRHQFFSRHLRHVAHLDHRSTTKLINVDASRSDVTLLPILSNLSMATVSKALLIMGYSSSTSLKLSTESEYRRQ